MTTAAKSVVAASAGRVLALERRDVVDQFGAVGGGDAVRRQALDRVRPGDANAGIIGVGLVVEIFRRSAGRDTDIDLALTGDAGFPPFYVRLDGDVRGAGGGVFAVLANHHTRCRARR